MQDAHRNDEAQAIVDARTWFHSFEVLPGVWTPGRTDRLDPSHVLSTLHGLPESLAGKRALDIGTLDGPYAFELERRGAEVVGLDIQDPDRMGFNTAKTLLGSKVSHVQANVYELTAHFAPNSFDIVLFFGVWYHLKNPLLAFEQINAVLASDGELLAEGECLISHMEFSGPPSVSELAKSPIPLSIFYSDGYKGSDENWFVPNEACVKAWLKGTSFSLLSSSLEHDGAHQRMRVNARKQSGVRVDNRVW